MILDLNAREMLHAISPLPVGPRALAEVVDVPDQYPSLLEWKVMRGREMILFPNYSKSKFLHN